MFPRLAPIALIALLASAPAAQGQETVELVVGRSHPVQTDFPVRGAALTDPAVAEVQVLEPRLVLLSGKAPGTTDLLLWAEDGRSRQLLVSVGADTARIAAELGALLPGSELDFSSRSGATLVSGRLASAEQARVLAEYFTVRELPWVNAASVAGGQQVAVQVRLAEVSRNGLREMGLNVLKAGESFFGGSVIGNSVGGPINPVSIGAAGGATALGNVPFEFTSAVTVSPSVTLFGGFPKADIEYFVQALAENDYLRLLAEPNLVALSGEEARFLAGGEFPIPVVQGSSTGGTSVTIEWKQFGVSLRFLPVVLGDGAIRLRMFTEVSELSDVGAVELQGFEVPSVVTRNAESTLELHSGQTFALAGLLSQQTSARVSRVPGLGDLPVLGALFRSTRYRSGETELLMLVTTTLVEPLSAGELPALPGEEHVVPSDWELYVGGVIEGEGALVPQAGAAADWMRSLGLASLAGPGGWARHGQGPAASRARPAAPPLAQAGGEAAGAAQP